MNEALQHEDIVDRLLAMAYVRPRWNDNEL